MTNKQEAEIISFFIEEEGGKLYTTNPKLVARNERAIEKSYKLINRLKL